MTVTFNLYIIGLTNVLSLMKTLRKDAHKSSRYQGRGLDWLKEWIKVGG